MLDQFLCEGHGPVSLQEYRLFHTSPPSILLVVTCGCAMTWAGGTEDMTFCSEHGRVQMILRGALCTECGSHQEALLSCTCDGFVFTLDGLNVFRRMHEIRIA